MPARTGLRQPPILAELAAPRPSAALAAAQCSAPMMMHPMSGESTPMRMLNRVWLKM